MRLRMGGLLVVLAAVVVGALLVLEDGAEVGDEGVAVLQPHALPPARRAGVTASRPTPQPVIPAGAEAQRPTDSPAGAERGSSSPREVLLAVRDASGRPVEGAGVYANSGFTQPVGPVTDIKGLTTIVDTRELKLDTAEVQALGYDPAPLAPHIPLGERVDIVLQARCRLRVTVEWTAVSEGVRSCSMRLQAPPRKAPMPSTREQRMGAAKPVFGSDNGWVRFGAFRDAGLDLLGVEAGVPYELSLLGAYGGVLETRTVTLGPREWRDVHFVVDRVPARLEGAVRWPNGRPVGRAVVRLVSARDGSVWRYDTSTDAFGAYAFQDVLADAVTIEVEHRRSKAMVLLVDVPVHPPVTRRDIVFQPEPPYLLELREQGSGRRVSGATGTARCGPLRITADSRNGALVFVGLSAGPVDLEVRVAGRSFPARREAGARSGVLEIPAYGALAVRVNRNGREEQRILRLELTSADGQPGLPLVRVLEVARGDGPAFVRFPIVFAGRYTLQTVMPVDGAVDEARAVVEIRPGETTTFDVGG